MLEATVCQWGDMKESPLQLVEAAPASAPFDRLIAPIPLRVNLITSCGRL